MRTQKKQKNRVTNKKIIANEKKIIAKQDIRIVESSAKCMCAILKLITFRKNKKMRSTEAPYTPRNE